MKGYTAMHTDFMRKVDGGILDALGFDLLRPGRACTLCPLDAECMKEQHCDLDPTHAWVPDDVAVILKMNGAPT